ncbi:MAG: hypothetical protein HY900_23945 [Deltaproteobacteria bacterium]|nr:hypothetical protein [Deltaproteobacteria bacterium]
MTEAPRITPQEAHAGVRNGRALLVCSYDDPPAEHTAAGLAARSISRGFRDAKALLGGVQGWVAAAYGRG